jgi:hypothetical protein
VYQRDEKNGKKQKPEHDIKCRSSPLDQATRYGELFRVIPGEAQAWGKRWNSQLREKNVPWGHQSPH